MTPTTIVLARTVLGLAVATTGVARLVASDAAEPKTHVLFLGADLEIQHGKEFHRVKAVTRRTFTINVDGKPVEIPIRRNEVGMKVGHALKLSETSAVVSNLEVERAYTAANEPMQRFEAAVSQMGAVTQSLGSGELQDRRQEIAMIGDRIDQARDMLSPNYKPLGGDLGYRAIELDLSAGPLTTTFNRSGGVSPGAAFQAQMNSFTPASTGTDQNTLGQTAQKNAALVASDQFDAIELSFSISSPKPLNDPYLLVTAQIAVPGDKPNENRTWVYATDLKPVKSDILHVRIKEGGFPSGYALKSYQIHLYNRGLEVATNVADRRVELTRDEAFEYVMLDYLAANKGKTLAPSVAMGRIPPATQNELQRKEIFVRVGKDGLPHGVFTDARCDRPIDDVALDAALRNFRFRPALEQGKPVDGVARLDF